MGRRHSRKRRQIILSLILTVLVLGSAGYVYYLNTRNQIVQVGQESVMTDEEKQTFLNALYGAVPLTVRTDPDSNGTRMELLFCGNMEPEDCQSVARYLSGRSLPVGWYVEPDRLEDQKDNLRTWSAMGLRTGLDLRKVSAGSAEEWVEKLGAWQIWFRSHLGQSSLSLIFSGDDSRLNQAAAAVGCREIVRPGENLVLNRDATQAELRNLISGTARGSLCVLDVSRRSGETILQLLSALQDSRMRDLAADLLKMPAGTEKTQGDVRTTAEGYALMITDLSREAEVRSVLSALKAPAIFCVTMEEVKTRQSLIQMILEQGHQLAMEIQAYTAVEALTKMLETEEEISAAFHLGGLPVHLSRENSGLDEAVAAGGYTCLVPGRTLIEEGRIYATDASVILSEITSIRRGELLHLRLNFLRDETMAAKVLETLAGMTDYRQMSLAEMAELGWNENPAEERVMPSPAGIRLAGSPGMNPAGLTGFTEEEIKDLNLTGHVGGSGVYLTLDGWGDDREVTEWLRALHNAGVYATFFVPAEAAENPNLLHALEVEGHAVALLTKERLAGDGKDLSEEEAERLAGRLSQDARKLMACCHLLPVVRSTEDMIGRTVMEKLGEAGFRWICQGISAEGETEEELSGSLASLGVSGAVMRLPVRGVNGSRILSGAIPAMTDRVWYLISASMGEEGTIK